MKKDWIEVELGSICDFIGGGTPSKTNPNYWDGDIPWASIKDIKGSFLFKTEDFISEEGLNNSASNLAFEGDIILATRINPGRPIVSKIKVAINQDLKIVNPLIQFSPRYLFYLFKEIEPKVLKLSSGTTVLGINLTNLKSIPVPLSPLPEQRAIVARIEELFSELDHAVSSLHAAQAKLEIFKKSIIQRGVTGQLTYDYRSRLENFKTSEIIYGEIQTHLDEKFEFEKKEAKRLGKRVSKDPRTNKRSSNVKSELPEIPPSWGYYRLEDVSYLITDGTHFTPKYQDSGVTFLSVKNVRPFKINDKSLKYISEEEHLKLIERCKPEKGDILYTKVGATFGYAAQVKESIDFSIFVSLCLIKPISKFFNIDFLEILMNSELVFSQARQRVSGSGVPDLHLIEIRDFKIPLLSIEEQTQIVQEIESRLSVADKLTETIQTSLQKAEALRQSILKKSFEGQLLSEAEVEACRKEADWEPAERLLERIKNEKKKK